MQEEWIFILQSTGPGCWEQFSPGDFFICGPKFWGAAGYGEPLHHCLPIYMWIWEARRIHILQPNSMHAVIFHERMHWKWVASWVCFAANSGVWKNLHVWGGMAVTFLHIACFNALWVISEILCPSSRRLLFWGWLVCLFFFLHHGFSWKS